MKKDLILRSGSMLSGWNVVLGYSLVSSFSATRQKSTSVDIIAENTLMSKFNYFPDWMQRWKILQSFWNEFSSVLAYMRSYIVADRRPGWWEVVLISYFVEVALHWLREAWDSCKSGDWPLRCWQHSVGSFFRFCSGDDGHADLDRLIPVLAGVS